MGVCVCVLYGRRSAANASSVTLWADVGSWTQTCSVLFLYKSRSGHAYVCVCVSTGPWQHIWEHWIWVLTMPWFMATWPVSTTNKGHYSWHSLFIATTIDIDIDKYLGTQRPVTTAADLVATDHSRSRPACKNWVMRCWCGYLSEVRCRLFAYGPADATAIPKPRHSLPRINQDWVTFVVPGYPGCPGKEAVKRV